MTLVQLDETGTMRSLRLFFISISLLTPIMASASLDWETALRGSHRSEETKARDAFRHPQATLQFFGISPDMTILEVSPGGGWYTEVLAPLLKERGQLIVAHASANGGTYARRSLGGYLQKLSEHPDVYGRVRVVALQPPAEITPTSAESVDLALAFRNIHSWLRAGTAEQVFRTVAASLKPGGIFGIVQHRGASTLSPNEMKSSAYVSEDKVIRLAELAGLKLDSQSEINANSRDTKDHPSGVWTLPPTLAAGEKDRQKYIKIGESDRMTLRFIKPAE